MISVHFFSVLQRIQSCVGVIPKQCAVSVYLHAVCSVEANLWNRCLLVYGMTLHSFPDILHPLSNVNVLSFGPLQRLVNITKVKYDEPWYRSLDRNLCRPIGGMLRFCLNLVYNVSLNASLTNTAYQNRTTTNCALDVVINFNKVLDFITKRKLC